jgi:urea transport system permease protein
MIVARFFANGLDARALAFLAVILAVAVLVPVLHLALPPGHPLHLSGYVVGLLGKYLTYALLALSIDLV